jgi:hypothetical protein
MTSLARLSPAERTEIWRSMKRHPIGPVALRDDGGGFWRLIGFDILDDASRSVLAGLIENMLAKRPANPDWDDSACMGAAFDFVGWMVRNGFGRFFDDRDPDGYEHWIAEQLRLGIGSRAEQRANARALRERGWRKPRGKPWERVRPQPRLASGSFVAKLKDLR